MKKKGLKGYITGLEGKVEKLDDEGGQKKRIEKTGTIKNEN